MSHELIALLIFSLGMVPLLLSLYFRLNPLNL